jgi:aminomethyltransferase
MEDLVGGEVVELPYYHLLRTELDGIPLVVSRTGWSGEVGYEVYLCDGRRGVELWERIMDAGRSYNIAPTAPSEIRRIEAGILNYGADMTIQDNPYEVGLGWLVDLDKGADFIGKEALGRISREGVSRRLVGVEIEGPPIPGRSQHNQDRWPVALEGRTVGYVPDAVYSPRLTRNIGYAMVPVEHSTLGTRLEVTAPWGTTGSTVVRKPFVDPGKKIPKA